MDQNRGRPSELNKDKESDEEETLEPLFFKRLVEISQNDYNTSQKLNISDTEAYYPNKSKTVVIKSKLDKQ